MLKFKYSALSVCKEYYVSFQTHFYFLAKEAYVEIVVFRIYLLILLKSCHRLLSAYMRCIHITFYLIQQINGQKKIPIAFETSFDKILHVVVFFFNGTRSLTGYFRVASTCQYIREYLRFACIATIRV